jgi:ABC-type branched-subunit amino acid transport system substrate-binding protein
MARRFTLAALAAAAALMLSACGSGSSGAGPASSAGATIKIGAWFPLTGPIAASGIPQQAGADAYFKQLNAAGGINGRKIDFIAKDNAYDAQQTIQVARQLIGDSKVVAIVSANGTATSAAAFPYVLHQAKVPILLTDGGAATWYDPVQPLLYGYQALYEEQAAALGAWAAQEGAKKITVVTDDPAAFLNVAKNVEPGAHSVDGSVSVNQVTVKLNTTDYSPIVAQVKAKSPDAVVLITPYPEAAAYLKQAKLQGVTAKAYGYAPTGDAGLIKLAGDAAQGFRSVSLTKVPDDASAAVKEYQDALAKYESGQSPSFNSIATYAAAKAFATVLKSIKGAITSASIADAFAKAGTVDTGILPPLTFSASQHLGTSQVQRIEVNNGAFVPVGDFYTPPPLSK